MTTLSLWTFATSFGGDFTLTIEHYCGLAAVALCIISFFVLRRFYKFVFGATLILGLLNLINFTPGHSTTSFYINSLSISFQPVSFFICILTIILILPKRSEVKVINTEQISVDHQKQFDEDVTKFKNIFINKPTADLSDILTDSRFTAAAKDAARQILDERQAKA